MKYVVLSYFGADFDSCFLKTQHSNENSIKSIFVCRTNWQHCLRPFQLVVGLVVPCARSPANRSHSNGSRPSYKNIIQKRQTKNPGNVNILSFRLIDRPDRFNIALQFSWHVALSRVHYMNAAARSSVIYKSHTSTKRSYKYLLLVSHAQILERASPQNYRVLWRGWGRHGVRVLCERGKRGSKISSIISLRCVMRALSFSFIARMVSESMAISKVYRSIASLLYICAAIALIGCVWWCHSLTAVAAR